MLKDPQSMSEPVKRLGCLVAFVYFSSAIITGNSGSGRATIVPAVIGFGCPYDVFLGCSRPCPTASSPKLSNSLRIRVCLGWCVTAVLAGMR